MPTSLDSAINPVSFVGVSHLARQQGGHEFGGIVRLQPGGLIGHKSVRG